MAKGDIETYYEQGEWKSRRQGEADPFATGGTKEDAVAEGREVAEREKVEHIIKKQDGTIGEKNSYGGDPRNIPG